VEGPFDHDVVRRVLFFSREVGWIAMETTGSRIRALGDLGSPYLSIRCTTGRPPPAHDPKGGLPALRDPSQSAGGAPIGDSDGSGTKT
jgi:hypothetical protein